MKMVTSGEILTALERPDLLNPGPPATPALEAVTALTAEMRRVTRVLDCFQ